MLRGSRCQSIQSVLGSNQRQETFSQAVVRQPKEMSFVCRIRVSFPRSVHKRSLLQLRPGCTPTVWQEIVHKRRPHKIGKIDPCLSFAFVRIWPYVASPVVDVDNAHSEQNSYGRLFRV